MPVTSRASVGVGLLIPTISVVVLTNNTPLAMFKLPVVVTTVKSPVLGVELPTAVPSIVPPVTVILENELEPVLVTLPVTSPVKLPENPVLAVIVVPVIAAGAVPPIIALSIAPPLTSILAKELVPELVILPVTLP